MQIWVALAYTVPTAIGSALAAYFSYRASRESHEIKQQLVTGNDKSVGEMVTEVHGKESAQDTDFNTHRPELEGA